MKRRVWPELELDAIDLRKVPALRGMPGLLPPTPVRITSPDVRADLLRVDKDGNPLEAFHDPEIGIIFVSAEVKDSRITLCVSHEYLHALFRDAGSTPGDFFEVEEQAVELLELRFTPFLRAVWRPRLPCSRYRSQLRAHAEYVRRRDRAIRRGHA